MKASTVIQRLEAIGVGDLSEYARATIAEMTPQERDRYYRKEKKKLEGFQGVVAVKESKRGFNDERAKRAKVVPADDRLLKIIVGGLVLEGPVPIIANPTTGRLTPGSPPVAPAGTDSCWYASETPSLAELQAWLDGLEHLPVTLPAWSTEPRATECIRHDVHLGSLAFVGIPDVRELGLTPCPCQTGSPHRYRTVDVRIHVGPFVWGPGESFDSPCPEADEELAKFVALGHVVDLLAKHPKPSPKAPAPPPTAEQLMETRLAELGVAPPKEGD